LLELARYAFYRYAFHLDAGEHNPRLLNGLAVTHKLGALVSLITVAACRGMMLRSWVT
jgi:hypothetical protein